VGHLLTGMKNSMSYKFRKVIDPLQPDQIIRCEILNEANEVIARVYNSKDKDSVTNARELVGYANLGFKLKQGDDRDEEIVE
jgi:hypothetical protein